MWLTRAMDAGGQRGCEAKRRIDALEPLEQAARALDTPRKSNATPQHTPRPLWQRRLVRVLLCFASPTMCAGRTQRLHHRAEGGQKDKKVGRCLPANPCL